MTMYSIDFETEAIVQGSKTPPKPVGCAMRHPNGGVRYWAWGHPTENNCTYDQFREALLAIWDQEFVGHNICGFDLEVAYHHLDMPKRPWELTHDTLFQAYLINPHAKSLKLKDLASDWLGMPTDAQSELYDWILANVPECRTRKQCGMYICRAPGDLVGRYAEDDVHMAQALHDYCWPKLDEMHEAYDRERRLAPILAEMKQNGIRIDVKALERDYHIAIHKLHSLDALIREHLASPSLNPGSDKELVQALQDKGYKGFLLTPTGRLSANKESLEGVLKSDPELQRMLRSRQTYSTLTGTFMGPWLEYAKLNGGTINPSYNQVRNPEGYGTRTGRLSSDGPNGQNIPGDQGIDYYGDPFPQMRSYCLPLPGHVWASIDFKNQEPRLAAHFEDGKLLQAFIDNPNLDPYLFVMETVGGDTSRTDAKVIFLGILYTMGAQALADKLGCDYQRADQLRKAIRAALPDINQLDRDCKRRFELGLPIRTLGGRICHCEPPSGGRSWSYKALNLLVQGSAADQTKEAIIFAHEDLEAQDFESQLLGTVHDEINVSIPPEDVEVLEEIMLDAVNSLPCDVPMRITFGVGKNWAEAAK